MIRFLFITLFVFIMGCQKELPPTIVHCDFSQGACQTTLKEGPVLFSISPQPISPMDELLFQVRVPLKLVKSKRLILDLNMVNMNMGHNQVILVQSASHPLIYKGKGSIVACPSGKKKWTATLQLPGLSVLQFQFEHQ
jgi:hypothetical protein